MKTRNKMSLGWLYLSVSSSLLIAVAVPLYLIGVSPLDYAFLDLGTLVKVSITVCGSVFLALCLLYQLLKRVGFTQLGDAALHFLLFWVVGAGLLFPVATSTGMTDASEVGTNYLNLFLTLAFSVALTVFVRTTFGRFIYIFLVVMIGVSIGGKLTSVHQIFFDLDKTGFTTLSKTRNVLVFCFDGIPGPMANEILDSDPELKEKFKDFNIYSNVVATSPGTLASLMGELYGNIDLKSIAETEKGLLDKLDKRSLLMNYPDFDVYTYGEYNHFNLNPSTRVPYGGLRDFTAQSDKVDDVLLFYSYVAVRIGTGSLVGVYDSLKPALKGLVTASADSFEIVQSDSTRLSEQLKEHKGFAWDKRNIASLSDLNKILSDLEVGTRETVVRYMHFTFTHFPVDFDGEGNYRSHEEGWFGENQTEDAVRAETGWAMTKVGEVVDRLKEVGAYQNTLLVLKSDHGKPTRFFKTGENSLKINNHNDWGVYRYRPMLMLKGFEHDRAEPEIVEDLVLLDDLAITLSSRVIEDFDSDQFIGVDLLSSDRSSDREFFMYVPEDETSDWRIDTHKQISVSRNGEFLDSLLNHNEIIVGDN